MHSAGEKETVPLSIHHLPFALTFAFFGVRPAALVQPTTGGCTHRSAWEFALLRAVQWQMWGLPTAAGRSCGWGPDESNDNLGHELRIPLACCAYRTETWWF